MNKYYHVTPIENAESIKTNGIMNDGEGIFVIDTDDLFVIKHIALNQIFCPEVAVFQIDVNGLKGKRYHDKVSEMTSNHQFYSKQKRIDPKYIRFNKEYKFNEDDMVDFFIQSNEKFGVKMDRNYLKELFKAQMSSKSK